MYHYLDAAMVRAPAWQPKCQDVPWPDLTGPDATPASWRAWLSQVWQIPGFGVAAEAASTDLACRVSQIRAGRPVPEPDVRRVVISTLRYLLRATSRATPFGLFAGVTAARIGSELAVRTGAGHRVVARPAAEWVTSMAEHLEADAELRPHLTVIANHLAAERDGYLIIEHRSRGAAGGAPERVRIRVTPPVVAALEAARRPILMADLAAVLTARFPAASREQTGTLLAELVEQRFLITSLRSPMTEPNPLAALLAELDGMRGAAAAWIPRLRAIVARLDRHDAAPASAAARNERAQVLARMAQIHPATTSALAIDLRLDWDLVIPRTVAAEAASAAGILARLARLPALSSGWSAWHSRFLERYGPGAVVPILDAVDAGTGLGYPASYLGSRPAEAGLLTSRDTTLLTLVATAAIYGHREVVLDDALVAELAVAGPRDPVQPSTELTVRVHAASLRVVQKGQFTLHVTGVSRAAGATTGRFLTLLDPGDRRRMATQYAALPGIHHGALIAQVSASPLYANAENIARAPQATELVISLGEYCEPGPANIPVTDLAVTADARRLHLVSLSRRRPVHTMLLSAVDLAYHSHPLTRFLIEAPVALAAPCAGFEWGAAASAMPFLPALRYGRTIVSPARWKITAGDLPRRSSPWQQWEDALAAWSEQVRLPERVYLGDGDQCINLDLAQPCHRALLRTELNRAGTSVLRPAPGPQELGWAGGRAHEIVIPVASAGPADDPVRWPAEVTGRDHGHLPGCDGRLFLKLYGPRDRHDAILTRHLPSLLSQLPGLARWWFIRYADPGEHLRLRLIRPSGGIALAVEQAGAWIQDLRRAGLITYASWDTYYPETARFGGTAATDAAEAFFTADSAAVLAQLRASARRNGPDAQVLTAASLVDIATSLIGDDTTAMRWLTRHIQAASAPPPRALYDQAVALANPASRSTPKTQPMDTHVIASWQARRSTLAAYRAALEQAGTIRPPELLPDLLHLHHTRMAGPDLPGEQTALHLARAAALSRLARTRNTSRG